MRRPTPVPGEKQTDKPLWYVDLGGSETLHMTIEQLIVARRSGKLGEGALVWREGMPRWRPVGTLIPATSITDRPPPPATAAPSPPIAPTRPAPPPAPSRQPAPSLSSEAAPQSFGSYERPAATLEFALEKAGSAPPREAARSPLPSKERASSPPARSLTPVPRPETWTASVANAKVPPPLALPAPVPARPAPLMPTTPSAPVSFASDRPTQPPVSAAARGEPGTRPRWVSVGIALLLCVTAASAGAFLVRSLKLRRQPPTLASSTLGPPLVNTSAATHAIPAASPAPANPVVVDLESLSLEHKAKRSTARPAAMPVRKPPVVPAEPSDDSSPPASDDPEAAPAPRQKPKNSDLPAAAQANPYTTGSDEPSL
jgi:hypothetical protein